ncbi:right-handed parallel beta-helix repeat-containing protein [Sphingomonas sp. G-3-2-10]|uniref:right-handed parallel beta-helix repeat-containing protein n=1 Tax=Sphingomonas sp. G-3-2-10 TaxID=2728838 RepID=UPI00146F9292|nr:right-handed parallel beta-helix repeat-containing protein [Sphingomonas sp. G-3-2-10]NML07283.1 right-handed parallel beta-helix repeat-containing protein [Sphingomonas sp. G-3-2-10]
MAITSKRIALTTAAFIGFGMLSAPAYAQATRTWVSGVGDDANPCSRTAPCKTFQGSISKTAAGGEINCLDPGGFGSLTITKSISIICDTTEGGVLVAATNAFVINSTTAHVQISGLDFEGLGQTGSSGINGINILNAASVTIRNVKIRGFRNGYGINVQPQNVSTKVFIDNVQISESGGSGNALTGGIGFFPASGFGAQATITNTQVINNLNAGVRIEALAAASSPISVTIRNSVIDQNASGILVKGPAGAVAKLLVTDSSVSGNTTFGIVANGAGVVGQVGDTAIGQNGTGVLVAGGATLNSFGTNEVAGNTSDGAFSAVIAPK